MNITHFLYCPFTGLGLYGGYRGDTWLKSRIRIFNRFVLPSLLQQTNKNFILWISWRPEEIKNLIVQQFAESLGKTPLQFIFTYEGLCFWDDKFDYSTASERLLHNLEETLPSLRGLTKKSDFIYMTIQPSDDMFLSTAVEQIQNAPYRKGRAVGWTKGYIMNYGTKAIAIYDPKTIPPFYTIMFPKDVFLDPQEHYSYTGPNESHEYIKETMEFVPLEGRGFVVGTHGDNISTVFDHPYATSLLTLEESECILKDTGTYFSNPLVTRTGMRLRARQLLNKLPLQNRIRSLYHSLPSCLRRF